VINPVDLVKIGAGAVIVAGAYFFGLHNGQNSEQLKIARTQISELTATVKNYETQYKNQAIALAEMRAAESNARVDSDRMRSRIASLEKRAKTTADRDTVRCLELGAECRRLLQEARGAINYCRKALQ
jgi:methylthioribose-1-phosphate isomerase